ncbi:hypothetical protein M408DRAFT_164003 [Serendipita vermifera MAFF 305830]|uniref:Nephrocystin 3-like N-terminal domain-containing protein n=1 Tax=Serendipita vermifera MAFF 305830 TaxID=933852 RepID=A0A0C3AT48_SERVB|nr:hypothetical protein M408DRAFT_164003 [Serendipita vermifera MAFF 305830]
MATNMLLTESTIQAVSSVTGLQEQLVKTVEELAEEGIVDEEYDHESVLRVLYGLDIPLCQPQTRVALLQDIRQWAEDSNSKGQIFWLKDAAGTGKTTVAATLARDWQMNKTLGGRFFFTPNSTIASGIDQFCTVIACDTAKQIPALGSMIANTLKDVSMVGFHQQFQRLIIEPMNSLKQTKSIILVIDALDNCDPEGREVLLNCLLEKLPGVPQLKVLLTSRPNPDIVDILQDSNLILGREVQLLNINDTALTDIRIYIHTTLGKLTINEREQVVKYSGGLFIVAATACRLLQWSGEPAQLLHKLINADTKDHLDELYLEVLRQAVADPFAHDMMMSVLQIIIVAFQPVSINTIRAFLPKNMEVERFVQDLSAVLKDGNPDRPIKVLHPTFREFLAEEDRANGFLINTLSSHTLTAIGCLATLEAMLDYDVFGFGKEQVLFPLNKDVKHLEKKVVNATTAAVRYAASYWAYHVAACLENGEIWSKAVQFINTRLLNWIELMSWRGTLGNCIEGLLRLRIQALRSSRGGSSVLDAAGAARISQAYQFILLHQPIITDSALQTYSSALAFTPEGSSLFDGYRMEHVRRLPKIITTAPNVWTTRSILTGHTDDVRQLRFSPDGSRLATISLDKSLILWDTTSGAIVGRPYKDKGLVESLAFSPDSQYLVFCTKASIHLWHTSNGKQKLPAIDAGSGEIAQVDFSPVSSHIVSGSIRSRYGGWKEDNNIRLWSTLDGRQVGQAIQLDGRLGCFAVSPVSNLVVCISNPGFLWHAPCIVTLWDLESGLSLAQYDMPIVDDTQCVSYSHTGDRFITWDQAGTLYLRDGRTGVDVAQMKGSESTAIHALFSLNGKILASTCEGNSQVFLWSAVTGDLAMTLIGHTEDIQHISFAQDSDRVATISWDQTIKVWDTTTGDELDSFFNGYTGAVYYPTLSADWSKLVTISESSGINLYDADVGTMQGEELIEDEVESDYGRPNVAFSPRGDIMVCGFTDLNDRTSLGLWNLDTCTPHVVPMEYNGGILHVAFSPDGRVIASLSMEGELMLWDGCTGCKIGGPFTIDNGRRVYFSPNSRYLASSAFRGAKILDIEANHWVWSLGEWDSAAIGTFSSNSCWIAGSSRNNLCVWDFRSGSTIPLASTEVREITRLSFGPTDDLLACATSNEIHLWRFVEDLQLISTVSIHSNPRYQLGISSNGHWLAYGHVLWDIRDPEGPVPLEKTSDVKQVDWREFSQSLLTYHEGWIYSATPPGPLLPIPSHLWDPFNDWHAYGRKMVVWKRGSRLPLVIDCTPLVG